MGRALRGGPQPLRDHPDPHHDVADHQHPVVEVFVPFERGEDGGDADGDDGDADHLDQHGQPEEPVIGVERRGEPGEIDPRPGRGERAQQVSDDRGLEVALGERMSHLDTRHAEPDHEHQVVEEFQARRDAPVLVRIAARHRAQTVAQ